MHETEPARPARRRRAPIVANPDPALRKPEAAQYLGISPRTLDRYIKRGLLTPVRIGPALVGIRQSELERMLSPAPPSIPAG